MLRYALIAPTLFTFASFCPGQQQPCAVDVPVNVVLPNDALIRRLSEKGFVVKIKGKPVTPLAYSEDADPRRIVFVVDTGPDAPASVRKIESAIMSSILSEARPEDSFAVLTALGPRQELRFGSSRSDLDAAARPARAAPKPKGKEKPEGVLDALMEATGWLRPHQAGDSIILMTAGMVGSDKFRVAVVQKALLDESVRLFGFFLGALWGYPNYNPHDQSILELATKSGGIVVHDYALDNLEEAYTLNPRRLAGMEHAAIQVYKAVDEYYDVRIPQPARDLEIELAKPIAKQLPYAYVAYPRHPRGCASPTAESR